ncbi:MAG: phospholipid/cholesterol/gamma-HCH transport system substrate-binding protein [Pseudonocardiales bacterium]|jgi:phospholipid/cholesterol/gamma-HCH transport system substrate-binding protein|nr:phospholipid/cholesterol/gamma-HCH transport system substrate-binding protein [Pseudonocardiales bacterium]
MNWRPLVRLIAFLIVAGVFALMELNTLTGPHTGKTDEYAAMFSNPDGVSGLRTGNSVKVAGVAVGKVTAVDLVDAQHAKVTFTANRNQQVTSNTWAVVRYANLLGQRYLALTQSKPGGKVLPPGTTIPPGRTAPALSLTDLFNGFRPLFSALTPDQVNRISQDIIAVLQGQTSRIEDLIVRTADLTGNLANRDQTFRTVVDGLDKLLTTVSRHDDQLANVVTSLHGLTSELHEEGSAILGSLDGVDRLIGSVGRLFQNLNGHSLAPDIADAASLTKLLAGNTDTVAGLITGFASAFETFSRISQNGNWINIYACNVYVKTYGKVNITLDQVLGSLGLLGHIPGIGGHQLDVPLKLPNGRVGGAPVHTGVCS